jgi:2-iminobutanoate/2-iminopropanoate deaminase
MERIERLQPATVFPIPGINAATKVGNLLFVSGQVPFNNAGELVGTGDFGAQAQQVFANLGAILQASGSGFDRIIKLTSFFTDISRDLPTFREVRNRHIAAEHAPSSSAIQVAQLFLPAVWLEVEAVALCQD